MIDNGRVEGRESATDAELERCPKCGIARYYLDRAHPNVRPLLDKCGHRFHCDPAPTQLPTEDR